MIFMAFGDAIALRRLFCWTCLTAYLFWTGCNTDRADAVRLMNQGIDAFELGQSSDAAQLLEQAADTDLSYAEPLYFLGQLYQMRYKDAERAEEFYRRALERDNENPQYAYRLGAVLADQGKYSEAIRAFRTSVERKPDYARAWYRLGLSYQSQQQYIDAIDSFTQSIQANARMRFDANDPGGEAYYALGDLYTRYGLYDHAIQVFENGLLNNPQAPRLYHGLGVAQLELERYGEAAASFEKAIEINQSFDSALFNLAVARDAAGDVDKAIQALERYVQVARGGRGEVRVMAANTLLHQLRNKQDND